MWQGGKKTQKRDWYNTGLDCKKKKNGVRNVADLSGMSMYCKSSNTNIFFKGKLIL